MRRLTHTLILAALSFCAALAGLACGTSSDDSASNQNVAALSTTPTAIAQTVTAEPTEESIPAATPTLPPTPSPTPEATPSPTPTPFPEPTPTPTPEYSLVTSDPSQPDLIWRFEAPTELWGATVTDGVVLTSGDNNVVYALDAVSGELLWEYEDAGVSAAADGIAYVSVSMAPDNFVYVVNPQREIHALNASTGELLWTHEGTGFAAVAGGIVYIGSWDYDDTKEGLLYALSASNGESLWEYKVEAPSLWPIASDGVVYLLTTEAVHALNAPTGSLQWRYEGSFGRLTAADGMVFVTTQEYVTEQDLLTYEYFEVWETTGLHAILAATGDVQWNYEGSIASLRAAEDSVYVTNWDFEESEDSSLYALSATTGEILWDYQLYGPTLFGPSVSDGITYLPAFQRIHALDAGALLQEYHVEGFTTLPPAIANDVLYVGSVHLYAFSTPQR